MCAFPLLPGYGVKLSGTGTKCCGLYGKPHCPIVKTSYVYLIFPFGLKFNLRDIVYTVAFYLSEHLPGVNLRVEKVAFVKEELCMVLFGMMSGFAYKQF